MCKACLSACVCFPCSCLYAAFHAPHWVLLPVRVHAECTNTGRSNACAINGMLIFVCACVYSYACSSECVCVHLCVCTRSSAVPYQYDPRVGQALGTLCKERTCRVCSPAPLTWPGAMGSIRRKFLKLVGRTAYEAIRLNKSQASAPAAPCNSGLICHVMV